MSCHTTKGILINWTVKDYRRTSSKVCRYRRFADDYRRSQEDAYWIEKNWRSSHLILPFAWLKIVSIVDLGPFGRCKQQENWKLDIGISRNTCNPRTKSSCTVAAARLWKSLPSHVTAAHPLSIFCSRLKSHLFTFLSYFLTLLLFAQCPRSDSSFCTLYSLLHLTFNCTGIKNWF